MAELQPQTDSPSARTGPVSRPADPLAGLYRMSNTAGLGSQDYVAINPTAIASMLMGFASVLVVLSNILLIIPLVGFVCGIVAVVQIRRSNQTQSGIVLASLGILLAVVLGGGRVGYDVVNSIRVSRDEQEIARIADRLGGDVASHKYTEAYQLFDDRFRARVPYVQFESEIKNFDSESAAQQLGSLKSIEWNHQPMLFQSKPGSDEMVGYGMMLLKFEKGEPRRLAMEFSKTGGVWRLQDIPALFPSKQH